MVAAKGWGRGKGEVRCHWYRASDVQAVGMDSGNGRRAT